MRLDFDRIKLAMIIVVVALFAAALSLAIDFSDALVRASTPIGVAFSGTAGVAAGAIAARSFPGAALCGAAAGFTNALAGIGMAMFIRDVDIMVLVGGSFGGAVLGAITGVLGQLLVMVVKKRGQPLQR